jgi:5-methylcytosine-specific restriction endonuclease McrA
MAGGYVHKGTVTRSVTCSHCGSPFTVEQHYGRPRTVCDPCKAEARRDDRRAAKYRRRQRQGLSGERVYRQRVWERDGYRCQLCGDPLAMGEQVPHPHAPTIDHVLPLAKGGLHTMANVQAAHFICNSLKSDTV